MNWKNASRKVGWVLINFLFLWTFLTLFFEAIATIENPQLKYLSLGGLALVLTLYSYLLILTDRMAQQLKSISQSVENIKESAENLKQTSEQLQEESQDIKRNLEDKD